MAYKVIYILFVAFISLSPLPFGSVEPWARGSMAVIVGAMLIAWGITAIQRSEVHTVATATLIPMTLMIIALIWATIQTSTIVPMTWHHPLWKDMSDLLNVNYYGRISINPVHSTDGIMHLLTVSGIFLISCYFSQDPIKALQIVYALSIASFIYASYGIVEVFSGTETILWFPKHAYFGDLTSTFVNRNNYATLAGMGWICFLALFFRSYSQAVRGITHPSEKIRALIVFMEKRGCYLLIGTLVQASALLLTHSRAGFASTFLGILVLCACLTFSKNVERTMAARFAIGCVILAVVFYAASGRGVDERLASTTLASENRAEVYAKTEQAIANQPYLGTGLGSFEDIFRFYRTPTIVDTFDYAHDTYLESALELGIPAATSLVGATASILLIALRGAFTRRRDAIYPCLSVAIAILVAAHSLVDFSVQIPAVSFFFATLMGVGFGQSFSSRQVT